MPRLGMFAADLPHLFERFWRVGELAWAWPSWLKSPNATAAACRRRQRSRRA
jgi:hypothetical protein